MPQHRSRIIAVVGATGLQGGAVTRRLLEDGWAVRALTRNPQKTRARALAGLGADVMRVDTSDPASLEPALRDAHGVYSVQNHHLSGYDGEVTQSKNVADVAERVGVQHLVYCGAGVGVSGTGIGSWETKIAVASHLRSLDLPVTILRPMAFMELMTDGKFFPPASTWHVMPKLMGSGRPVGWLAVEDLAAIAAKAFAEPERFVGRELPLVGDVLSIDECRDVWREVTGRSPRRFPMPVWMFERFVGTDETTMWRWLRSNEFDLDPGPTLAIRPEALTVRAWLTRTMAPAAAVRGQHGQNTVS
ncbi:MAG TPA: NmrA/HSCARG family protein [Nitriliruptorales bacterium]|nr:NmrA/HSCARG family protein [Nitriliruptorales bacterium]